MKPGLKKSLADPAANHGWSYNDLDIPELLALAGAKVANRGREYYAQKWRLRLHELNAEQITVGVQGTEKYLVDFLKQDGEVFPFCDCPYADIEDVVCKHMIAAAMFLQDHLRKNQPESWEDVVTELVRATTSPLKQKPDQLLFFSLQDRGASWAVVPYAIPAAFFPETARLDPVEAERFLAAATVPPPAIKVDPYDRGRQQNYLNVSHTRALLVKTLASSGVYYGKLYGGATIDYSGIFTLLAGGPLFLGTEKVPLQHPLEVWSEPAHIELELARMADGATRMNAVAVSGERVFPLFGPQVRRIAFNPIWLLSGSTLFPLEESPETLAVLQKSPTIDIPVGEEHAFFENHLQSIADRFPLRGDAVHWEEVADALPVPRLYLTESAKDLRVELRFGYGGHELPYNRNGSNAGIHHNRETGALVRVVRHPEVETEWLKTLGSATYGLKRDLTPGRLQLRANAHPLEFLLRFVPLLTAAGAEIYGEEELKLGRVNRNRATISFGVTSGIDWFDVQAVVHFGEIEVGLKEVRRALRKRQQFIKLADGSVGEIPPEWVEQYRHLFALGEETDGGLRVAHHHLGLLDQLLANDERARTDDEFKQRAERLRNFGGIKPRKLPRHFTGELRPYQKAGFDWLYFLHDYHFGGCLADDMGTGKTVVTLAFLQSLKERGLGKRASLLAVPRSLIFNWEREAARFTPRLRILNHATPGRTDDVSDFAKCDLVLTTYGLLRRDLELLRSYEFNYLILDEAQAIKNPLAETAKAVRLLRGAHRLTLTGTPVENNTLELWSQFAFLNPGLLGNADYFREEFSTPIERKGDEAAAVFLRKMVYPFILRRTKDQVAPELPPRTERQLVCDMEPAQRKLYNERRDYYRALLLKMIEDGGINNARFRVLEGLLRLRQICNHPRLVEKSYRGGSAKFELLLETLETLRAEGHKALVFSQFVGMLKLVQAELKQRGIPFSYLDGKTRDRQERVDQFQNDASIPFFLISLKAGGVGLNLTAADYVIHIDPWWNPAVEMQATDRTHRIGQDKPVFIFKLIVRDSVEEKVVQLQERKRDLVTKLVSTESSFFKSLTADDVTALFS